MPNGKQKLVMVPGTGVVAFPGEMEDEHVAAAIRAFRSQNAADQAALKSHPVNRPQPLTTEQNERQRQMKPAQPLATAIPHLPAWLSTPSTALGWQAGGWLSGEIGKSLGTQLPDLDPSAGPEAEAAYFRAHHPVSGGIAHGISDFANSLTSPAGTALMLTAPESKLMSAFFATQALRGAYKDAQAAHQAYQQGNNEEATRYATESILGGAMGLAAGAHAVRPELGPQGEVLPPEAKPGPEFLALGSPTPVTLEGNTGGFALPEHDEAPIANYQLIYKSPAADPLELNAAVQELVNARESRGWSDPNATDEEARQAQQRFYAAADRLGRLQQKAVGQIRQIPSGEKIVYLTEAGLQDLSAGLRGRAPDPEYSLNGVSISGRYIPIVQANLAALNTPHSKELIKLLGLGAGPDGTVTVSAVPTKNETLANALSRLREELNHGWQKQFSDQMGNHLPPIDFRELNRTIPDQMSGYLHTHGYPDDDGSKDTNRMRVLESSAKMMSGAPSEFGLTPDQVANYLFQYFDAISKRHGPKALDELVHTTNLARNIKRDYANARYPSRGSQGQGTVSSLPAGGQGSPQAGAGAPGLGTAAVTGPPAQAPAATPSLAALRDEAALRQPSPVPTQTTNLSYVTPGGEQPFYLKSDQIIDQKMKGPMSGPQILQMLRNNGVKEDELETTGLADMLSEDRKFTPDEVKEFAAANPVQIQEISKGSLGPSPMAAEEKAVLDWAEKNYPNDVDDIKRTMLRISHGNQQAVGDLEFFGVPDDLLEPFRNFAGGEEGPKYGQYTEPGGENYREILMTFPNTRGPKFDPSKLEIKRDRRSVTQGSTALYYDGKLLANYGDDPTLQADGTYRQKPDSYWQGMARNIFESGDPRNRIQSQGGGFRSPHWDEPNVLVHFRVNDRTLPNGKKVLHVEEVQSDWAQKGRKEGFAPSLKTAQTIPLKAERKDGYWEVTTGDGRFVTNAFEGEAPTEESAIALARYRLEHEPRHTGFGGSVPAMPFAKTWHELALRRILKYAVDHGYDGVSWTPGEKQAGRYDLSKQVNRIAVIPRGEDRAVRIEPKGGSSIKLMVDKNGTVTPAFSSDDQFAGKNIADVVGKEVADKIMAADKEANLTGLDLKVGGHGMVGFYDKIVPDYLNKIGKRFGAKVGTAEVDTLKNPRSALQITPSDHGWEVSDTRGNVVKEFLDENYGSEAEAKQAARDFIKTQGKMTVPFLPITPAMRSEMAEPGPLFNQTRKPSIEASKAAIAKTPFTPSQAEHWGRYYSAHDFKTEQEARDFMFRQLEHNDQQSWADLFGKNGPEKNRQIANTVPLHRVQGGKWKIGPKPKPEPVSTERLGSGEQEGNAPDVNWFARDNEDTGPVTEQSLLRQYNYPAGKSATVYQAYVPVSDIPEPKLAEEQDPEEDRASYPWEDFGIRHRSGGPPPAKLLVKPNGKIEIMDGNHRIRYWTDQGYDSIPAWVIDQRKGVKVDEPEMNQTRKTPSVNDLLEEAKKRAPEASLAAAEPFSPGVPTKDTTSEPGYIYHATNLERAEEIAQDGMRTHKPWEHTDQSAWPDGSTKKRSYFSPNAGVVWQFAPEEGKPVILRVKQDARFKRESTGDVFTNEKIPASDLEILDSSGTWVPIKQAFPPSSDITMNLTRKSMEPSAPTNTPEFRRWFGDSKVTNADGTPKVLYHSTNSDWNVLDPDMAMSGSLGFHAGTKEQAERVRETGGTPQDVNKQRPLRGMNVMPVYLKIDHPLRMKDHGTWYPFDMVDYLAKNHGIEDPSEPPDTREAMRIMDWPSHMTLTYENATKARKNFDIKVREKMIEWRKDHPDASRDQYWDEKSKVERRYVIGLIEKAGYDGIVYDNKHEGGGDSYMVFHPGQIKSALGNRGTFDPTNPDITMNQTRKPGAKEVMAEDELVGKIPVLRSSLDEYKDNPDLLIDELEKRGLSDDPRRSVIGLRGVYKEELGKIPRRSWHSPDGERQYRLKGTSTVGITGDYWSASGDTLRKSIPEAIDRVLHYGDTDYVALIRGDLDKSYSNDIGESVIVNPEVIAYIRKKTTPRNLTEDKGGDLTMNQIRATKEDARPDVKALMAEALRRRPQTDHATTNVRQIAKEVLERAPVVVE